MKIFFAWSLAIVMSVTHGAESAPLAVQATRPATITLTLVDEGLSRFKAMLWSEPQNMGPVEPDSMGATMERDLATYVLAPSALERITELRNGIANGVPSAASPIPDQLLTPLDEAMHSETCRFAFVKSYWSLRREAAYHEEIVGNLIARLPSAAQHDRLEQLQALKDRINAQRADMEAGMKACTGADKEGVLMRHLMRPDPGQLFAAYNTMRKEIAVAVPPPTWSRRTADCPAQSNVGPASEIARPRRVTYTKDLADFYPAEAVMHELDGAVRVRVAYDAGGCVMEAVLAQSSGSDLLDRAAVEFSMTIRFQPAIVDGMPVADGAIVPINFSLLDTAGDLPKGAGKASGNQPQP